MLQLLASGLDVPPLALRQALAEAAREVLGMSLDDLADHVAAMWGLPDTLRACMRTVSTPCRNPKASSARNSSSRSCTCWRERAMSLWADLPASAPGRPEAATPIQHSAPASR
mgnify:CR=1 FL=1